VNDEVTMFTYTFTGVVVLVLFTICVLLLFFLLLRSKRRQEYKDDKHTDKRIEERYATLEYWLITKPVHLHDEKCAHILSKLANSSKVPPKHAESTETFPADDLSCTSQEGAECPICLSEFSPNQIASWSMNTACQHVFHHECIKVSLKRNTSASMSSRN
jgi:hypothetical protein